MAYSANRKKEAADTEIRLLSTGRFRVILGYYDEFIYLVYKIFNKKLVFTYPRIHFAIKDVVNCTSRTSQNKHAEHWSKTQPSSTPTLY